MAKASAPSKDPQPSGPPGLTGPIRSASDIIFIIQGLVGTKQDRDWGPLSQAALERVVRMSHESPPSALPPDGTDLHPFVRVAREWIGRTEDSPNRFHGDRIVWADTNYPNGWEDRARYCAAFQCYVVAESIRRNLAKIKERPVSPSVSELRNWARLRGFMVASPRPGDHYTLLPSGTSHIGLVESVSDVIHGIEANTNDAGSNDGDGFWRKNRRIGALDFFRIPLM